MLAGKRRMLAIGIGTINSGQVWRHAIADVAFDATTIGGQHIECASVYAGVAEIGKNPARQLGNRIQREEL
jgi:diketogulonate reductase-like aldo/keto reductase